VYYARPVAVAKKIEFECVLILQMHVTCELNMIVLLANDLANNSLNLTFQALELERLHTSLAHVAPL